MVGWWIFKCFEVTYLDFLLATHKASNNFTRSASVSKLITTIFLKIYEILTSFTHPDQPSRKYLWHKLKRNTQNFPCARESVFRRTGPTVSLRANRVVLVVSMSLLAPFSIVYVCFCTCVCMCVCVVHRSTSASLTIQSPCTPLVRWDAWQESLPLWVQVQHPATQDDWGHARHAEGSDAPLKCITSHILPVYERAYERASGYRTLALGYGLF